MLSDFPVQIVSLSQTSTPASGTPSSRPASRSADLPAHGSPRQNARRDGTSFADNLERELRGQSQVEPDRPETIGKPENLSREEEAVAIPVEGATTSVYVLLASVAAEAFSSASPLPALHSETAQQATALLPTTTAVQVKPTVVPTGIGLETIVPPQQAVLAASLSTPAGTPEAITSPLNLTDPGVTEQQAAPQGEAGNPGPASLLPPPAVEAQPTDGPSVPQEVALSVKNQVQTASAEAIPSSPKTSDASSETAAIRPNLTGRTLGAIPSHARIEGSTFDTPGRLGQLAELSSVERIEPEQQAPGAVVFNIPSTSGASPVDVQGKAPPSVVDQIGNAILGRMEIATREGKTEIHLRLDPPELGPVRIHLSATESTITAHLVVQDESTRHLIESQLNLLRQRLGEAGVSLGGFDVAQDRSGSGGRGWQREPEPIVLDRSEESSRDAQQLIARAVSRSGEERIDLMV